MILYVSIVFNFLSRFINGNIETTSEILGIIPVVSCVIIATVRVTNMAKSKKISLPALVAVQIQKGDSGVLIATLDQYNAVTEASDLNELFFNVNDLIYTIFDIPKKYQNEIQFLPTMEARINMVRIAHSSSKQIKERINFGQFRKSADSSVVPSATVS